MSIAASYPLISAGESFSALGVNVGGTVKRATMREVLTADRTYYVRTDGSDSNNGLANTSGGAFLTIQKALDTAATIDFNGYVTKVKLASGTYSISTEILIPVCVGQKTPASLTIEGDTTTPSNVVVSSGSGIALFQANVGTRCFITGIKLVSGAHGLRAPAGCILFDKLDFGACTSYHILPELGGEISCWLGGTQSYLGTYTISGSATYHVNAASGGRSALRYATVTLSGTPAFSVFAYVADGSFAWADGFSFTGTATGARYSVLSNSVVQTQGGGASLFPGNSAGATASGGLYI